MTSVSQPDEYFTLTHVQTFADGCTTIPSQGEMPSCQCPDQSGAQPSPDPHQQRQLSWRSPPLEVGTWDDASLTFSARTGANCPGHLRSLHFSSYTTAEETRSAVTPNPAEVRSRGGCAATCGRLVCGDPNGFSLIGRAICHSWDGFQGEFLP